MVTRIKAPFLDGRATTFLSAALLLGALACSGGEAVPADDADAMAAGATDATPSDPTVVATGLNGPIGVLVEADGTIWIGDSGVGGDGEMQAQPPGHEEPITLTYGETARIVRVAPDGTQTDVVMLPSIMIPEGPQGAGRFALLDGELYVTSGGWSSGQSIDRLANTGVIVHIADGTATEFVNVWEFEDRVNPDPVNRESNPFDLTVGPDNALWMTDAAGNSLLRVDPATNALELKAVFAVTPGPIPNAGRGGAMEIEPVPTAVAFDASGEVFVSLLGGLPFLPGSSKVVRVSDDGQVTDYATDLTMLTDLVTGPDGQLYGVTFGPVTEQGPTPNAGTVVRIGEGTTSETLLSGLPFPSSIAFTDNGDAYVTVNSLAEPGTGEVWKYTGLVRVQ